MTASPPALVAVSDAELLAAAARGERPATDALVRRYVDFVYGVAVRQTGDRHAAEDVTQAVFLVLFRRAGTVRAPALAAWLHQTTRYAAANARRAARRRRAHEAAAARPERVMPTPPPEADPLLPLLDDALAALGAKDRSAVIDRYLLGRDTSAVATSLGMTPKAAQKRLERALVRLRGTLAAQCFRHASKGGTVRPNLAPLPAGIAGVVLASAASTAPAAPPTLAVAVSVAVASPAAASVGAVSIAKGVNGALAWLKLKLAAMVLAGIAGTGAVAVVAGTLLTTKPATPPPLPPPTPANVAAAPAAAPRATLASGVSIVFVGVSQTPSAGWPWYGADGRMLSAPPFDYVGATMGERPVEGVRELAFDTEAALVAISDDPAWTHAATLRFNHRRSSGNNFGAELMHVRHGDHQKIPGTLSVVLKGRPGEPMRAAFDVAAGPWVPRVVSRADADVLIVARDDIIRVMLTKPFDGEGEASIGYWPAEFYSDPDKRLVAIDTAGGVHLPRQRSWDYRSPPDRTAEPVLDAELPAARFDATPFGDVLDRVRDETGLFIEVDWAGLAGTGVTVDTPVTTRTTRMPLHRWLPYVFQSVRGTRGGPEYVVKDGVVTIRAFDYRRPRAIPFYVPDLPLERLARFEVQTRAFDEWVAFDGLPVDLGRPGRVVVTTSDAAPAARPATRPTGGATRTLADGTVVELVAIGDAANGDCWRPDGTPTPPPFGDQQVDPAAAAKASPGTRRLWAVTTARRPDGRYVTGRHGVDDPKTNAFAPGARSSQTRDANGVRYQLYEFEAKSDVATLDWRAEVASRPAWRTSIERGADGWAPNVVGHVRLGDAGDAFLWGPSDQKVYGYETSARVWTPPALGRAYDVNFHSVLIDGGSPHGSSAGGSDAHGFRTPGCHAPLDAVYRMTLVVTHFDQAAVFRGVALRAKGKQ